MRRSNFALMDEARKAAESEGVALNQLINVAVAEKVSALRTEEYFRDRAQRANRAETMRILARAGRETPPAAGDELTRDRVPRNTRKKKMAGNPKPAAKTKKRTRRSVSS